MRRILFGTLSAFSLATLGFGVALWLAADFVYPGPSDLDRGLARVSFAFGGAFVGLLAGALLGFVLKPPHVLRTALAALLLGSVTLGILAWRSAEERAARAEENRAAEEAAKLIPPPLPGPGLDMLRGLVTVPPEKLARFETKEHAYEEKAVTVYGRQQNWYLVGLADGGGQAWLNVSETGKYFPVQELVVNRNNYLTEGWVGRVRDVPDESTPSREVKVPPEVRHNEVPARVLEAREAGGMWWYRVDVLERSPCEGGTPKVIASGWIPAWYGSTPAAWFYSRGC